MVQPPQKSTGSPKKARIAPKPQKNENVENIEKLKSLKKEQRVLLNLLLTQKMIVKLKSLILSKQILIQKLMF